MNDTRTRSTVESALGQLREPSLRAKLARASVEHRLFGGTSDVVRIGRFVLIERIGVGAMGVVYAAHDPELDRRVALKVLREGGDTAQAREAAAARLLREAKAMARLDHPNVVKVFEVGRQDELTFVAMEEVEGTTLRRWLETERAVDDVLAMFVQAGRGLAAAHGAGVIHRDFKPENVLVDEHERARVADFGVARLVDGTESMAETRADVSATDTRTAGIVGTPAYMAPEQLAGTGVDARSDQFGFCVALWEALLAERPFGADSVDALAAAMAAGPPDAASLERRGMLRGHRRVSGRVMTALRRGLAHDPAQRWPDMNALLDQLSPPPRAPLGRVGRWGVALVGLVGAGGLLALGRALGPAAPCTTPEQPVTVIWNPDARARVTSAIVEAGGEWGAGTAANVVTEIDRYRDGWVEQRREACEATHVRHQQSERRLDLRMSCLDRRLQELQALVTVLAEADAETAAGADAAVEGLTAVTVCADVEILESRSPLPEDDAARRDVEALRPALARIKALVDAGKFAAAVEAARTVKEQSAATLTAYPPSEAELRMLEGEALAEQAQWAPAQVALEAAAHAALAGGDRVAARDAWIMLARLEGARKGEPERARLWLELARAELESHPDREASLQADEAEAAIIVLEGKPTEALKVMEAVVQARNEDPSVRRRLESWTNLASTFHAAGEYEEATRRHQAAVALARDALGPNHPDVAVHLVKLADSLQHAGHLDQALEVYEESLALAKRNGDDRVVPLWNVHKGLTATLLVQDRIDEAIEHGERSIEVARARLPADDVRIGFSSILLGQAYVRAGQPEKARETLEQALSILESQLGADHPHVGTVLGTLADLHYRARRYDQALSMYERGLGISEAKLGAKHPRLGFLLVGVGQSLIGLERADEAIAPLQRAVAIREAAQGEDSPTLVLPLIELARAHVELGNFEDAVAAAERALASMGKESRPVYRAYAQWQLARGLAGVGQRARARKLAREALAAFEQTAEAESSVAEIRAFLGM